MMQRFTRFWALSMPIASGIGTQLGFTHAVDNELVPLQPALATGFIFSGAVLGMAWPMTAPYYLLYRVLRRQNDVRRFGPDYMKKKAFWKL